MKEKFNIERDEEHVYTVDGKIMPSVTQILQAHLQIDYYHQDDYYKDRGSEVDRCSVLYLEDDLDWDTIDPRVRPFIEQFKIFCETSSFSSIAHHGFVHDPVMGFAGEFDLFGTMGDWDSPRFVLIDIKTGSEMPHYKLQTAMYVMAFLQTHTDFTGHSLTDIKRFGLYLARDHYKLKKHDNPVDFSYAQSICLANTARKLYV
jgi:hypothetical protein